MRSIEPAEPDLGRAIGFAEERGRRAADRVAGEVLDRVEFLASQPAMGSPVELDGEPALDRSLVAGAYPVYYRVTGAVGAPQVSAVRERDSSGDPATLVLG